MRKKKNPAVGSAFEDYLQEQGTLTETTNRAIKRVIAFQLHQAMKEQALTKKELAERMHTSRAQLDRVLDPDNDGVTLHALINAADAVGRKLTIEMH